MTDEILSLPTRPDVMNQEIIFPMKNGKPLTDVDLGIQDFFFGTRDDILECRVRYGMASQVYKIDVNGGAYAVKVRGPQEKGVSLFSIVSSTINSFIWKNGWCLKNYDIKQRFEHEREVRQLWLNEGIKTAKDYETGFENVQVLDWIDGYNLHQLSSRSEPKLNSFGPKPINELVNSENLTSEEKLQLIGYVANDLSKRHEYAILKDNPLLIPMDNNPSNSLITSSSADVVWLDCDNYVSTSRASVKQIAASSLKGFICALLQHSHIKIEEDARPIVEVVCQNYENKEIPRSLVETFERHKTFLGLAHKVRDSLPGLPNNSYRFLMRKVPEMMADYV